MTIERRRPLPAGRYWLDILEAKRDAWEIWSHAMSSMVPPRVRVETTQHFDSNSGAPSRDFVIFQVLADVVYSDVLPSPNVAPASVTQASDVAQRPDPPPDVLDQITTVASQISSSAKVGIVIGITVAAALFGIALTRR